jgi:hypothetical protein
MSAVSELELNWLVQTIQRHCRYYIMVYVGRVLKRISPTTKIGMKL